jgi:restriction system protein
MRAMTVTVPPYPDMLWPALQELIALGGSAAVTELDVAVIEREEFSPKVKKCAARRRTLY